MVPMEMKCHQRTLSSYETSVPQSSSEGLQQQQLSVVAAAIAGTNITQITTPQSLSSSSPSSVQQNISSNIGVTPFALSVAAAAAVAMVNDQSTLVHPSPSSLSSSSSSSLSSSSSSLSSSSSSSSSASSSTSSSSTINKTTTSMSAVLAALCGACCGPICDRYIMRVVDAFYHESCLQCTSCSVRLMHSCFTRNGKLYCRIDYERLFLKNRCLGCGDRISSDELVMRTSDNVFHLKCFSCVVCGCQLQKGEQYVVKQSQLFCRSDYEKEVEMLQGFNDLVDDYFPEDVFPSKIDGRRGPKRPRTILNTQQRRAFKASFDVSPKPCRKVRETLAKETGLSLRIVQVWFQNQRAKVKKIQKKARQEPKSCSETESLGESSLENENGSTKIKDENESDTESFINGNLDNDQKLVVKEEQQQHDEEHFKRALHLCTNLQNYKDDMGMINNNDNNNMQLTNTIMGLTYSAFQQLMTPMSVNNHNNINNNNTSSSLTPTSTPQSILNPIDRLYSMQNAYFRCDDSNSKFHGTDEYGN